MSLVLEMQGRSDYALFLLQHDWERRVKSRRKRGRESFIDGGHGGRLEFWPCPDACASRPAESFTTFSIGPLAG